MHQFTVITTSRPWKLEVLRLKSREINQLIQLNGIDPESSEKLIDSIVKLLNKKRGRKMCKEALKSELVSKNLEQFRTIPVLLIQLVCLWHDGTPLGNSQCTIYSGMINLLIELAEKRLAETHDLPRINQGQSQTQRQLPKCFDKKQKCQDFKPLLFSLGQLAYETLFSPDQESALVFDSQVAELHGLSKAEVYVCLKIRILSQSKLIKYVATRMKSLSFLHKTFQEYLAALFISMNDDPTDQMKMIEKIFTACNSTEKIFEMSKIFLFVSGMSPEVAYKLSKHIPDDSSKQKYRNCIDENFFKRKESLEHIQQIMINCVKESLDNNDESVKLQLEDFFITTHSTSPPVKPYLTQLIQANISNIKSVYIDRHLPTDVQELLMGVSSLTKLVITVYCDASKETVYTLVSRSSNALTTLDLCSTKLQIREVPQEQFSNMLQNMMHLRVFRMAYTDVTHAQLECLMAYLSAATQIRQIYLHSFTCHDHSDDCSYQLDLSRHQQLQLLNLYNISIDKVLVNTTEMLNCRIWDLFKPGLMTSLLKSLRGAMKLERFKIGGDHEIHPDSVNALVGALPMLEHLQYTDVKDIDFGEQIVKLSPKMKDLKLARLSNVTMTRKCLCDFVDSIPDLPHKVDIELVYIKVMPTEETANALNYIRECPRFNVMYDSESDGNYRIKFHTRIN